MGFDTLRARLKRSTASLHQEIEGLLPLVSPGLTLDRYREALQLLYGFHAPHEEQMAGFARSLPFPLRDRAARLEQDLLGLGLDLHEVHQLPRCEVPRLCGLEQLAGWVYVFEGAALGGQIVSRSLRNNLELDAASGASFFQGDGSATGARWRQVVSWLEGTLAEHADPEAIVASACATFLRLREWVERR